MLTSRCATRQFVSSLLREGCSTATRSVREAEHRQAQCCVPHALVRRPSADPEGQGRCRSRGRGSRDRPRGEPNAGFCEHWEEYYTPINLVEPACLPAGPHESWVGKLVHEATGRTCKITPQQTSTTCVSTASSCRVALTSTEFCFLSAGSELDSVKDSAGSQPSTSERNPRPTDLT